MYFEVLWINLEDLLVPGDCSPCGVDGSSLLSSIVEGQSILVSLETTLPVKTQSLLKRGFDAGKN